MPLHAFQLATPDPPPVELETEEATERVCDVPVEQEPVQLRHPPELEQLLGQLLRD